MLAETAYAANPNLIYVLVVLVKILFLFLEHYKDYTSFRNKSNWTPTSSQQSSVLTVQYESESFFPSMRGQLKCFLQSEITTRPATAYASVTF